MAKGKGKGNKGNKVKGTNGNDVLSGSDGDDKINGLKGNDLIFGLAGNDKLKGGKGDDTLFGGDGDDKLDGGKGNDTLDGGSGDDKLKGGKGDDTLFGGDGDDTAIFAGLASDYSIIENGDGTITVIDNNAEDGDDGTDTVSGVEFLQFADQVIEVEPVGDLIIFGTPGDDVLVGGAGNDQIFGLDGNDLLIGGDGDDFIDGGLGQDLMIGGAGNDTLTGAVRGDVRLDFNMADYRDATGAIAVTMSATGTVVGDASVGTDTLINIDRVNGTAFNDTYTADASHSANFGNFNEFVGGAGNDTITGNGNTRAGYNFALDGVTANLELGTAFSTNAGDSANIGVDTFISGVNNLQGSNFADILIGSDGPGFEAFRGRGGNDFIDGGGGSNDRADYRNSPDGVVVDLSGGAIGEGTAEDGFGTTDTLVNIERIRGSEFADTLIGDDGNNQMRGQDGDDVLIGNGGNDFLRGGNDDDQLFGGEGSDSLRGENGDDTLTGGAEADFLTGGSGADDFVYEAISDSDGFTVTDNIFDFTVGQDFIRIETAVGGFGDGFAQNLQATAAANLAGVGPQGTYFYDNASGLLTIAVETANTLVINIGAGLGAGAIDAGSFKIGIAGTPGNETINGGLAIDIIDGGTGSNRFIGGAGDDILTGGTRGSFILDFNQADYRGATGAITVTLSAVSSVVGDGSVGTDTLINIDRVLGTAFNDVFTADSDWSGGQFGGFDGGAFGVFNEFQGGGGNDTITGNGFTRIDLNDAQDAGAGVGATVTFTGVGSGTATGVGIGTDTFTGVNRVRGSNFDDTLTGNIGNEDFRAQGGDDFIDGGSGIDRIDYRNSPNSVVVDMSGGAIGEGTAQDGRGGTDTFVNIEDARGSENDDTITGDAGNNRLQGRGGNDVIKGGDGDDRLEGGQVGNFDVDASFIPLDSDGNDRLEGGAGNDFLDGGTGFNRLIGGADDDTLTGGTRGSFLLDGNTADYGSATGAIVVTLSTAGTVTGDLSVGTDTLINIDTVRGTAFDDVFTADGLWTGGQYQGFGGGNFTQFRGGDGDDEFTGNGSTRIDYSNADARVTVDFALGTAFGTDAGDIANVGTDTILGGVNSIHGSRFNDDLFGSANSESFRARGGDDFIDGRGGVDRVDYRNSPNGVDVDMSGGAIGEGTAQDGFGGTDTFVNIENVRGSENADTITGDAGNNRLQGRGGNDVINGGDGDDTLEGGSVGNFDVQASLFPLLDDGNDTLDGGAGDDTLTGGSADDILTGGADDDTFVFGADAGDDTITDFDIVDDILVLEDGVGLAGTSESDTNGDTILDTVVTWDDGGSVTLLGVSGVDPNDLFT